jgi:hypothetical protein
MSPMKLDVLLSPSTPLYSRPRLLLPGLGLARHHLVQDQGWIGRARALGHEQGPFGRKLGNPVACEPLDLLSRFDHRSAHDLLKRLGAIDRDRHA